MKTSLYWSRLAAAIKAFKDDAHETWVVVEDFHPFGQRIVSRHRTHTAASEWLEVNRHGVMRAMTLEEYRRRMADLTESEGFWLSIARLSSAAWRHENERQIQEAENLAAVAARDPFAITGSMPVRR